ncbi:TrmB family transcriptional regulator [Halolamina salina]|uniref:TrmB family transcriptional regulator n=1 Tax=Halolamina salina TaxID=1220023 RepID=A0ABD6B1F3_9EURY
MRSDDEAFDAMGRLGFGTNEAEVLVTLHELGTATAREVNQAADVSRPQVYSAVESLENRGLVNVQHANPREFQPVTVEETESLLTRRFERDIERVGDRLREAASRREGPSEEREDIWTVRGRESVTERVTQLVRDAEVRVVFGAETADLLTEGIYDALTERAAAGVDVTVVSTDPAVRERFADADVTVLAPDIHDDEANHTGRMLLVDDHTVLHSVLGEEALPGASRETAYWSADSGFASTLIAMMERTLQNQTA